MAPIRSRKGAAQPTTATDQTANPRRKRPPGGNGPNRVESCPSKPEQRQTTGRTLRLLSTPLQNGLKKGRTVGERPNPHIERLPPAPFFHTASVADGAANETASHKGHAPITASWPPRGQLPSTSSKKTGKSGQQNRGPRRPSKAGLRTRQAKQPDARTEADTHAIL